MRAAARIGMVAVFTLMLAFGFSAGARGTVLTVNSTADDLTTGDGQCTLREAIINANTDSDTTAGDCPAGSGADEIKLAAGHYVLSIEGQNELDAATGDLDIRDELTITGSLTGVTVVDAGGIDRVLEQYQADLSLHDVVVTGGRGGIFVREGVLTLTNSTVRNNELSGQLPGGGYFSGCWGAGIFVAGGAAILRGSTVSDNTNACFECPGLQGCTPSGFGGGIAAIFAQVELINSTVTANAANVSGGGIVLLFSESSLLLHNSTVADNIACDAVPEPCSAVPGSGIMVDGVVMLSNSILENLGDNCASASTAPLSITSGGHNIDSDGSCGLTDPSDLPNTDPMLGPLEDNGGPTLTHAPLPGSPAIDAIPVEDCVDADGMPLLTDQRGVGRPQGSSCDIGAVEVVPEPASLALGLSAVCAIASLARRDREAVRPRSTPS